MADTYINADTADIPSVNFAQQSGDVTTPASGRWQLYFKSGGLYARNAAGTVVGPFSVSPGIATDPIWAAAGDIVQASGKDAAAVLSLGTAYEVPQVNAGATALAYGPAATSWTPTLYQNASQIATSSAIGRWGRIGPLVWVQGYVTANAAGTSGQQIDIRALPVTPAATLDSAVVGTFAYGRSGTGIYQGAALSSNGTPLLYFEVHNGTDVFGKSPSFAVAATHWLSFSCWYLAA